MKYKNLVSIFASIILTTPSYAALSPIQIQPVEKDSLILHQLPGFFRFSFDNVSMPEHMQSLGLLGINYFGDITPTIYGGVGAYGAVTGTQGGLFTLGLAGGYHREFATHWWADAGLFVGGGGGKSSLVGGGLMLRPYVGVAYSWSWARLGLHYSYIDFPNGKIRSQQVGLDLDVPTDFYYLSPLDVRCLLPSLNELSLSNGYYLNFQRNDFAILLQAYRQRAGTLNANNQIQDGTIGLVGAELDHYFTPKTFWWLKAAGAYSGIPNGYMDVLGGLGYHWSLIHSVALVPQFGIGAGGGGMVNTGGGFLINPQLGIEWPLTKRFSARLSSGYMWSPKGDFKVVPITGEILYHMNFATGNAKSHSQAMLDYDFQGWRLQALNQTYLSPQRDAHATRSPINMIAVQIDQLFSPTFFLSYQGAAAYSGYHAGGYATGMIGPGLQSKLFLQDRIQFFTELLIGAGGGGGLSLNGGSLIEPIIGLRYAFTPIIGVQASFSEIKALRSNLNTPVLNLGITIRFDTLNQY